MPFLATLSIAISLAAPVGQDAGEAALRAADAVILECGLKSLPADANLPPALNLLDTYWQGEQPYGRWNTVERRRVLDNLLTKDRTPAIQSWWLGANPYRDAGLRYMLQCNVEVGDKYSTATRGFALTDPSVYDDGSTVVLARFLKSLSESQFKKLTSGDGLPLDDLGLGQFKPIKDLLPTAGTIMQDGVVLQSEKKVRLRFAFCGAIQTGKNWFQTTLASNR